jgi:hypothetical protein
VVLFQLDLRTLTDFRRVNQRGKQVTESIPQYKSITTHVRNVICGILSIETGRWTTCNTLYEKLCTAECEKCGDFGCSLYILTCKRVCFLCFLEDERFLPISHSHALRKFGVDHQILDTLHRMRSIPGIYSTTLVPEMDMQRYRVGAVGYITQLDDCSWRRNKFPLNFTFILFS